VRNEKAPMSGASLDARKRLGTMLVQRRAQLDPAFRNRNAFVETVRLDYRVLFDIENAKRDNFGPETLAAIEIGYGWKHGSITAVLDGGDPEPEPVKPHLAIAGAVTGQSDPDLADIPDPPADLPDRFVQTWYDVEPWHRAFLLATDLPVHLRIHAIAVVFQKMAEEAAAKRGQDNGNEGTRSA
jgi:hypothetical protein